jgi:sodium-type flagellar protein MotY
MLAEMPPDRYRLCRQAVKFRRVASIQSLEAPQTVTPVTPVQNCSGKPTLSRPRRWMTGVALFVFSLTVQAQHYQASAFDRGWQLHASALECRLVQQIPYFGNAVFRHNAGEALRFQLESSRALTPGDARLAVQAPVWRDSVAPEQIAMVALRAGSQPLELGELLAERLISVLIEGWLPVFETVAGAPGGNVASIALVAVGFRPAYEEYRDCVTQLLPVSFADVARTRIRYDDMEFEPDAAARRRIDLLLRHIELAGNVKAVYVDGYADDSVGGPENLELSRQRAEAVNAYLLEKGLPGELVTTRFHGTRLPVARGRSDAARAENRRVTIRLEK